MLKLFKYGSEHPITINLSKYSNNGNLYVGLLTHEDGFPEPWSNLTVNLAVNCEANCAFIDTNNNGEEIVSWLVENNLGKLTGRTQISDYCTYPEFEFDLDELNKHI